MSLEDVGEYEAVSRKPGKGFSKNKSIIPSGLGIKVAIATIILILGILLGHYYVSPFICEINPGFCTIQPKVCSDCFSAKKILEGENSCLEKYVAAQEVLDACSKN
ncbi:MAG: hypothetical protein WC308_03610 [archaeon]|jgi:hypothetical protein